MRKLLRKQIYNYEYKSANRHKKPQLKKPNDKKIKTKKISVDNSKW
jgi:hypothetical protein